MATQLALRLSDETLRDLDWLVTRLNYQNRTEAMRDAIVKLIDDERRRAIGEDIAQGYRRVPQTAIELEGLDVMARKSIEAEPWSGW